MFEEKRHTWTDDDDDDDAEEKEENHTFRQSKRQNIQGQKDRKNKKRNANDDGHVIPTRDKKRKTSEWSVFISNTFVCTIGVR